MRMGKVLMAVLVGCLFAGVVFAAPEPAPKDTKGQITGELIKKDGGRITVKGEEGQLSLIPYWRGGMPQDGGGFDKNMLKQLEQFKVGDKVKVIWVLEEHYRIERIELVEKAK